MSKRRLCSWEYCAKDKTLPIAAPPAPYEVTRALKGEVRVGLPFAVDPLFGTDCTAPLLPGASVLVFAYPRETGIPATSACGSKLAAPVLFEGKELQPAPEVTDLLLSLGQ